MAVSDGMSQSIFPQWWAEELVTSFLNNDWNPIKDNLLDLRFRWQKRVNDFLKTKQEKGEPTWMLENRLAERAGAGATLCAIYFTEHNWNGYVLGDSCLIEIDKNNKILNIFRSQEGDFGNHPDYFDSIKEGKGTVKEINGCLCEGHKLMIVSDPLAELLYEKRKENNENEYLSQLLSINNHKAFCELVDKWRSSEGMHNDDSTLVIVEYDNSLHFDTLWVDDIKKLCAAELLQLDTQTAEVNESPQIENHTSNLPSQPEDEDDVFINLVKELIKTLQTFNGNINSYIQIKTNPKKKKHRCKAINKKIKGLLELLNKNT